MVPEYPITERGCTQLPQALADCSTMSLQHKKSNDKGDDERETIKKKLKVTGILIYSMLPCVVLNS